MREKLPARDRYLLYALGFCLAAVLDVATPEGIADWLIEVLLVWFASVFGEPRETRAVCAIGAAVILGGLWTSPMTSAPFWMDLLNRLIAICVICTITHFSSRRRMAEEAERKAAREIKVLQGLLPICAACKAIRNPAGEWRRLESYLTEHSEAQFTHSLCPSCAQKAMIDADFQG